MGRAGAPRVSVGYPVPVPVPLPRHATHSDRQPNRRLMRRVRDSVHRRDRWTRQAPRHLFGPVPHRLRSRAASRKSARRNRNSAAALSSASRAPARRTAHRRGLASPTRRARGRRRLRLPQRGRNRSMRRMPRRYSRRRRLPRRRDTSASSSRTRNRRRGRAGKPLSAHVQIVITLHRTPQSVLPKFARSRRLSAPTTPRRSRQPAPATTLETHKPPTRPPTPQRRTTTPRCPSLCTRDRDGRLITLRRRLIGPTPPQLVKHHTPTRA